MNTACKSVLLLLLICGASAALSSAQQKAATSRIKCSLFIKDRMLDVKLEMPASSLDKTSFSVGDWAGQNNYAANIYRVAATDKTGNPLPVEQKGEGAWQVANARKPFALTYTVVSQKDIFIGNDTRNKFHPSLFKNYVFLWGHSFLLKPEEHELSALPVKLQITTNEYGTAYTNFPDETKSFDEFSELFVAAGNDYRPVQKQIAGRKVQFILQGKNWKFTDDQFIDAVSRIIEAQVKYMGFYPAASEPLLVTLNEGTPISFGGTVVTNVISVYLNPQLPLENIEMLKLISHEHFHIWNGHYLHNIEGKKEGYYKWLSEGFTEYYSGLTLYREGLIGEKEFTKWLNDLSFEYQTNPDAMTATADALAENYYKSSDFSRLPYVKGAILGLLLDLQLRQKTSGRKQIDDFMRLLMKNTEKNKGYNDEIIMKTLDELASGAFTNQFYGDFMLGAKLLPIAEILKNSGVIASEQPRDVFDIGFTTENGKFERGVKIKQVVPDSAAAKAGLKEGDELQSFSFILGRPQGEASIGVKRNNENIQVKFFPKKQKNIVRIDENAIFPK